MRPEAKLSLEVRRALALRGAKARVAVSGYGDEWDRLGWFRHERRSVVRVAVHGASAPRRTEVLWTNYQDPQGTLF